MSTISITKLNVQYAHRFLGYEGEAQYLHGHTGTLTIEVEGDVNDKTGFVYPCNGIKKIVWASSSAVYGIEKDRKRRYGEWDAEIMDEDTALCPGSLYSYTKTFNEGLSEFYRKEYGLDSIGLRVNLSYGPYIHSSF